MDATDIADVENARGTFVRHLPLTDQYGHGVLHGELGIGSFEALLGAASGAYGGTPPRGSSHFDSRLGRDVRRWCPPLLGLAPHCSPVHYLARRRELGAYAATRALLRGSGIGAFVTDTSAPGMSTPGISTPGMSAACAAGLAHARGIRTSPAGTADGPMTPAELGVAAQGRAREAVSLRDLAARVADTSGSVDAFLSNVAEALHAATCAVAFVSGCAFHEGAAPSLYEVRHAAGRWLRARAARTVRAGGLPRTADAARVTAELARTADPTRMADAAHMAGPPDEPALVRHLLWAALTTRRPVQLHCADPARLRPFLHATGGLGARLVLLPSAPYHSPAAQLAAVFPHVYADLGPSPGSALAEAPSGKLLFSSGAWALPELYVVAARRFVGRTDRLLTRWTEGGTCAPAEAVRIAGQLTHMNARHVYGLEPAPPVSGPPYGPFSAPAPGARYRPCAASG